MNKEEIEYPIEEELEEYMQLCKKLQQENEQLKDKIKYYENPTNYFKYASKQVVDENKQLKNNWNKLKEYVSKTKIKEFEKSFGKRYGKTFTQAEIIICNMIIDKMQELEEK